MNGHGNVQKKFIVIEQVTLNRDISEVQEYYRTP